MEPELRGVKLGTTGLGGVGTNEEGIHVVAGGTGACPTGDGAVLEPTIEQRLTGEEGTPELDCDITGGVETGDGAVTDKEATDDTSSEISGEKTEKSKAVFFCNKVQ